MRACVKVFTYNKTMLHTSAQHSAVLNNQYLINTYCIVIVLFYSIYVGVIVKGKGRVSQKAPGNKHFKTNPFLTFSMAHLEAILLYVMFQ